MKIHTIYGSILNFNGDAIVNTANNELIPGGGLDGMIHRNAGPEVTRMCKQIGYCPSGGAVLTPSGQLRTKYIIHAVGPRYSDGTYGEADCLRKTYQSIFKIADTHRFGSIALPAISTGIFNYPIKEAAEIAVQETQKISSPHIKEIFFYFIDKKNLEVYNNLLL